METTQIHLYMCTCKQKETGLKGPFFFLISFLQWFFLFLYRMLSMQKEQARSPTAKNNNKASATPQPHTDMNRRAPDTTLTLWKRNDVGFFFSAPSRCPFSDIFEQKSDSICLHFLTPLIQLLVIYVYISLIIFKRGVAPMVCSFIRCCYP